MDFHIGLFMHFLSIWETKPRKITDWDEVRKTLQSMARDKPEDVLKQRQKGLSSPPKITGEGRVDTFSEF